MKLIKFEPLKTVLTLTLTLVIFSIYIKIEWVSYIGIGIGILGLLSDKGARIINNIWSWITKILGYIMPNVLFTIVYYLFLTPVALLSRLFGEKNSLLLKNTLSSTFRNTNKNFEKKSFEKMW